MRESIEMLLCSFSKRYLNLHSELKQENLQAFLCLEARGNTKRTAHIKLNVPFFLEKTLGMNCSTISECRGKIEHGGTNCYSCEL